MLISNELGQILGQAYPERGVLFSFAPASAPGKASMKVTHIVLEPLSAEPFVLRGEANLENRYDSSVAAIWTRPCGCNRTMPAPSGCAAGAGVAGRLREGPGGCQRGRGAHAQRSRYHITRAQLSAQGRISDGIAKAQKAIDLSGARPHVKARALCVLGNLVIMGPNPNFRLAIDHHSHAVSEAKALVGNPHPAIRLAAKEVLLDSHLGAAHDVAWGTWRDREKAVDVWLKQAAAAADDLIKNEGGDEQYHFRLATRALAAYVGLRGKLDPGSWTQETIRSGETLIADAASPVRKSQLQWDVGMALYDSLQIYQARNELRHGVEVRRTGHAVHGEQPSAGVFGLERLFPGPAVFPPGGDPCHPRCRPQGRRGVVRQGASHVLEKPLPCEVFLADLGRHGETLVNIGISYWEVGQHDRGMTLTERGIALMEQAVNKGVFDPTALTVPYTNLANMHRQLGERDKAEHFDQMAAKNKDTVLR